MDTSHVQTAEPVEPKEHPVTITVNKKDVSLPDHKTTGLAIKEAAIKQGVPNVALDFDLFRVTGDTQHPVTDTDSITTHDKQAFLLIRPDHSS